MATRTMKDVAAALGVSVTSVSNAFNKPDRISTGLRERIMAGAEDLGYHGPDAAGRALRSGRANAFGVVFNERLSYVFTDFYAVELLAAFTEVLEEAGMAINLLPVAQDELRVAASPRADGSVRAAVIDGVVGLCCGSGHPGIVAARRRNLPIVLTDVSEEHDFVSIDDRAAGLLIGRHLTGLGHRRVGVVFDMPLPDGVVAVRDQTTIGRELDHFRALGWDDAARRVEGIGDGLGDADIVYVSAGRNTRPHGAAATARLLQEPDVTAVVAVSDVMALGALDEVRRRGLVVGRDVSVAGFDGVEAARAERLTTVVQPIAEKGRLAARLLLDPEHTPRQVVLPIRLHVGDTTGPASTRA